MTTPLLLIITGTVLVVSKIWCCVMCLVKSYHSSRRSADVYVQWYEETLDRWPGYDYLFCSVEEELLSDARWSSVKM